MNAHFKGHALTFRQTSKHKILIVVRKLRDVIYLCVFSAHQVTSFLSLISSSKKVLSSCDGVGGGEGHLTSVLSWI